MSIRITVLLTTGFPLLALSPACGDQCPPGTEPLGDRCVWVDAPVPVDAGEAVTVADAGMVWNTEAGTDAGVCEATPLYRDGDGDGFGDDDVRREACGPEAGWVPEGGDCDDELDAVHPGASERCNGRDDDCDGHVDEGLQGLVGAPMVLAEKEGRGADPSYGGVALAATGEGFAAAWLGEGEAVYRPLDREGRVLGASPTQLARGTVEQLELEALHGEVVAAAWLEVKEEGSTSLRARLLTPDGADEAISLTTKVAPKASRYWGARHWMVRAGDRLVFAWAEEDGSVRARTTDLELGEVTGTVTLLDPPSAGDLIVRRAATIVGSGATHEAATMVVTRWEGDEPTGVEVARVAVPLRVEDFTPVTRLDASSVVGSYRTSPEGLRLELGVVHEGGTRVRLLSLGRDEDGTPMRVLRDRQIEPEGMRLLEAAMSSAGQVVDVFGAGYDDEVGHLWASFAEGAEATDPTGFGNAVLWLSGLAAARRSPMEGAVLYAASPPGSEPAHDVYLQRTGCTED